MDNNGQDDKNVSNEKAQSSLDTNIGDTQDKEENVNANKEALGKKEDKQSLNVNIVEKENIVQGGNTPNEVKEQVITNNTSIEPKNQNVDKDLEQLLSRIEKGEPTQKLEDAQIKNIIGAIKAQLTATTNPGELERLAIAVASLASSTNNPELLAQINELKAAIEKKRRHFGADYFF